ncbi:MAG: hypothetical protein QOG90_2394 [Actinomycetota bacterium]|jgi:cellulose synthase/poly-beta-1,6-N-acetylglucosamine synthase-like glycosyltransferase
MTRVAVCVPCHRDEPGIARTIESLAASAARLEHDWRLVVCVNGRDSAHSPAADAVRATDATLRLLDVGSKPAAWNVLRHEPADVYVFADADVLVNAWAIPALVDAVSAKGVVAAAAKQEHLGDGMVAHVALVPHRLEWGGLLGTLYAARGEALPEQMPTDVLLDDAWLFAQLGAAGRVEQVPLATATVQLPTRWRDLWRQRVRAEAGKQQMRALGLSLAEPPGETRSVYRTLVAYPPREWPFVAALAAVKLAAALRARRGHPEWKLATTTKA